MKGDTFKQQNDMLGAGGNENCYSLPIARVITKRRQEDIEADKLLYPGTPVAESKVGGAVFTETIPGQIIADVLPGVVSFWKFEPGDLEAATKNGGIFLYARGHTHPPISVHAENPIS